MLLGRDLPPVELLEEVDLVIGVSELRPRVPLIPQVIDQVLEGSTISIKEHLVSNLFQLMHAVEHFFER